MAIGGGGGAILTGGGGKVVGPQPVPPASGSRHKKQAGQPPAAPPTAAHALDAVRYLRFYALDPKDPGTSSSFSVLPGDTPPTITGGYAQWQAVPRPLWRSLMVFQGYEPSILQLSVRFLVIQDGSRWDDQAGGWHVELDCAKLEWMAGMGRESGPPPYLYLWTQDVSGNATPLIPLQYQQAPGKGSYKTAPAWVITDLQWDQNPERNSRGYRIRQDATVTCQMYDGGNTPAPSTAHRGNKQTARKAVAFHARAGADTALAIAGQSGSAPDRFALAQAIVKFPRNQHLHLRGVRQQIKLGTVVWIPYNY